MSISTDGMTRRWAIIRFRLRGPFLLTDYLDVDGYGFRQRFPWGPPDLGPLAELLNNLKGPPVPRIGPHANGPYPVAVYYSLPKGIDLPELEHQFLTWIRALPFYDQLQPVKLSKTRRVRREMFSLPLRILVMPEAMPVIDALSSEWWLHQSDVPEFGLNVQQLDPLKDDLELTLRRGGYGILVTRDPRPVVQLLRRLPDDARPRLLICEMIPHGKLPSIAGVAVLSLDFNPPGNVLMNFLMGLIHDFPLHEALKSAQRVDPHVQTQLLADRTSNQSLRMREALIAVKREACRVRLASEMPGGGLGFAAFSMPPHWDEIFNIENSSPNEIFFQESTGVLPLARSSATFQKFWQEQSFETPFAVPGPRALDAALLRLDTEPWYTPVESNQYLQADAEYDLRVHIGMTLPGSLIVGDVTGIDQLIGPPDPETGHTLNISVQGKDFRIKGTRSFQVKLPRSGSTDPVYFRVRAPKEAGAAELRIYVHHRNHLVQSFLLKGVVGETAETAGSTPGLLTIRQEFAQSEEFANLDDLRPRALFLGLNAGQGNTHQIGIVADSVSEEVNLSASAFDQAVQDLRQELRAAILRPGGVATYTPVPKGQPPTADAADAFRKLARKGSAVYDALLGSVGGPAQTSLRRIQKALSRETIQIVRHDVRAAFPWTMLYDWLLPKQIFMAPEPPVCLGFTLDTAGNPIDCTHTSSSKVFCVRGFWGVRHYVEELLPQLRNAQLKIQKPAQDPVRIVASATLPEAAQLETRLKPVIGTNSVVKGPWIETDLFDLLWKNPAARPAVLVVLGHLQKKDIPGQPVGARIELQPGSEWMTLQELLQRIKMGPNWDNPRTILILAPCESAATDDQTLNDLVTAFSTAGAGAILGTQVEVGATQATDFAEQITNLMWNGATLGVAMQQVRSELVMGGDPGGFLFQSFGHVDLELQ